MSHQQGVRLTDPQAEFLKREAGRLGISVSDLIRRIIDRHREEPKEEPKFMRLPE